MRFPQEFNQGLQAAQNIKIQKKIQNVIICGMGGSALPGNILKMLSSLNFCLFIHRNYGLPLNLPSKNNLVICISYSGNTEETISAYQEAKKKQLPVIVITTGGQLGALSKKDKTLWAKIPEKPKMPPRMAVGYQFSALLKILINQKLVKPHYEKMLKEAAKNLEPQKLEKKGINLAEKIYKKIPVVYASERLKYLAHIWKIAFNENAKTLAFWNYLPEINHNEIAGYENHDLSLYKFIFLFLQNKKEMPLIKKRRKITASLLEQKHIQTEFINLQGKNILEKIFNNIILSDWTTYYLALKYQIDPGQTKIIEDFKKKMKN